MLPSTTHAVVSPVVGLPRRTPATGLTADAIARAGATIARYGVVVILLAIGLLKFTAAEAEAIRPLVVSSIAARPFSPRAATLGSALAVGTLLVTLSFLVTAPSAWDPKLGFPHFGEMGPFLLKDVVLLGASVWSLGEAYAATARR